MASFNITNVTSTSFYVEITLSNPFDKAHYQRIAFLNTYIEDGSTSISEDYVYLYAYPKFQGSTSYEANFTHYIDSSSPFVAGNTYTIYAYAQDFSNGAYWHIGEPVTITIPDDSSSRPEKPSKPYLEKRYLDVIDDTNYADDDNYTAGLELGCSVDSNIGYIEWRMRQNTGETWQNKYITLPGQTTLYGGLDFSTQYMFQIRVYDEHDSNLEYPSGWSEVFYTSTAPKSRINSDGDVAGFTVGVGLHMLNQIRVGFYSNSFDDSYSYVIATVKKGTTNITSDSDDDRSYPGNTLDIDYSNLSDGTYTVTVRGYYYDSYSGELIQPVDEDGNVVFLTKTFTVERPSKFYWTNEEKNIFENKRAVKLISYTRIEALRQYVEDMLSYKGKLYDRISDDEKYGTQATTLYRLIIQARFISDKEEDRTLTAQKFNIINHCICKMLYTGIDDKQSGEVVYGTYFTEHLVDTLNSV